jgi:hypothetical protein
MRKDTAAQVETREISDSDLDNVSGGVLGPVFGTLGTVDETLGSTLSEVTGLTSGVTGVNTGNVTGLLGL